MRRRGLGKRGLSTMGEKRILLSLGCTSGLATPDRTIRRRDAIVLHAYRETDTSRMFRESPQTGVRGFMVAHI